MPTRVLVIDTRAILATGLTEYLQNHLGVGEVASSQPGQQSAAATAGWHVVVTDEATARGLLDQVQDVRLVVLVEEPDVPRVTRLVAAGAAAVCSGDEGLEAVAEAVMTVATGGMRLPPDLVGPVLEELLRWRARAASAQQSLDQLTGRERQILGLLAQGLGRSEIAARLTLSPHTVRTHIQHLLRKLSLHSQLEASALGRALLENASTERLGIARNGTDAQHRR